MSNLILLDIEATSVNPAEAEIIELAILNNKKMWCDTFKPTKPIPFDVSGVTNIDNCMVEDRPIFNKSILPNLDFKNSTAVCHNADYDLTIVKKYGIEFKNYICTYRLAWWFYPDLPNHKLGTLRAFFGIPPSKLHRAEADTYLLDLLLVSILENKNIKASEAIEITQIADKEFYSVWQFGKYKGQKIDVSQISYIHWALSNIQDLHPKFKQNLIKITN